MSEFITDGNVAFYVKSEAERARAKMAELSSIVALQSAGEFAMTGKFPDSTVEKFTELYPVWTPGEFYEKGSLVRYGSMSVLVSLDHVASGTYLPGAEGTGALYRPIPARDGEGNITEAIRYMNVMSGERVKSGGRLWESLIDQLPYTGAYPPSESFPTVWREVV